MITYKPNPIDTTDVVLPRDLNTLMEDLSRSNHDTWSSHRLEEGWTYGPTRNDEKKQHPCLVPYEELTEIEKNYDRNTSSETLKSIYKLGFAITKSSTGNVMFVGSYNIQDVELFKCFASKYKLSIKCFDNWEDAKTALAFDLTKWHALVFDWKAPLKSGEKSDFHFLRDVIDDLNALFHKNRNEIPWFICPNDVDDKYTAIVIDFTIGRERKQKDWGGLVYNKENLDSLFIQISEYLPKTRNFRIRNMYDAVFDGLDYFYPGKVKELLFNILLPLHYPESFYNFVPTDYYNNLRRIVEATFALMCDFEIIAPNICYSHESNDSVNLRACLNFIKERIQLCPDSMKLILENILNITNEGSHIGNEYKTKGLYYSITGLSLQLCDVIIWLTDYIKAKRLKSISSLTNSYIGKEVFIEKDINGFYHYDKCIIYPTNKVINAYNSNKKIYIESVIENKGKTKKYYLIRAIVKRTS